jgi:hypothetical protein
VREAWIGEDLPGGTRFSVIDWVTDSTEMVFASTASFRYSSIDGAFDWDDDGHLEIVVSGDSVPNPGYHTWEVWGFNGVVSAGDREEGGSRAHLGQNRPNPFGTQTDIQFDLPAATDVTLRVYDIAGRLVRTLAATRMVAGRYSLTWDGRNDQGKAVSSGVYFYRLDSEDYTESHRMVILR